MSSRVLNNNNENQNISGSETITKKGKLNDKALYIRRDFEKKQDVLTSLDFTNEIYVKDATANAHPINYKQLKNSETNIINTLSQNLNVELETLKSIKYTLTGFGARGTSEYGGFSAFMFLDKDGMPYLPIAYNWNVDNFKTPSNVAANYMGWKDIYLKRYDETLSTNIKNARILTSPLIDEDKDFLRKNSVGLIRVRCRIESGINISNFNEWQAPMNLFKYLLTTGFLSGSQVVAGILIAANYALKLSVLIENEDAYNIDSISEYLTNVKGVAYCASAGTFTSSNVYYCLNHRLERILNEKYVDINLPLNWNEATNTYKKALAYNNNRFIIATTKDKFYNDLNLNTELTTAKIFYPNTSAWKVFGRVIWDDELKLYREARDDEI